VLTGNASELQAKPQRQNINQNQYTNTTTIPLVKQGVKIITADSSQDTNERLSSPLLADNQYTNKQENK